MALLTIAHHFLIVIVCICSWHKVLAIDCNQILSKESLIIHFLGDMPEEVPIKLSYSQSNYSDLIPFKQRHLSSFEQAMKDSDLYFDNSKKLSGEQAQLYKGIIEGIEVQFVWKQHTEALWSSNYRAEVLAYEISDLLKFNLVPITIERVINGKKGSLQLFYETPDEFIPVRKNALYKQELFDYIINHGDRHFDNYLNLEEGNIKSIDNAVSFTGKGGLKATWEQRKDKIDSFLNTPEAKPIIKAIKQLDLYDFQKQSDKYLGSRDSQLLIDRLNFLKQYFKKTNVDRQDLFPKQ